MATPVQKLEALHALSSQVWSAASAVEAWAAKVLAYLRDPVLEVSAEQRQRLLAEYAGLLEGLRAAAMALPEDLVAWEPTPPPAP